MCWEQNVSVLGISLSDKYLRGASSERKIDFGSWFQTVSGPIALGPGGRLIVVVSMWQSRDVHFMVARK